jgi:hypothetical protein
VAIGSGGEIGVTFARWGEMDDASRAAWHAYMRTHWGTDLLGGYAKLCTPDPEMVRFYQEVTWTRV